MLKLQIRPRIIRSFVGAPGPRQVPDGSSGRGSLRGALPPFGEVQNAVPGNVANTTNFIYVVAASTAKGVIRVYLLSRAGLRKAPSAGNGGPRPASYRPSASARANRGILKSREGGAEKGGQPPSGCRIHGAPPMPPAHRRATAFNTWFLGRPEIFDCGVWAAPKARETIRKRMGGDAPHICQWFPGPPAPPRETPQTQCFPAGPKILH